MNIQIILNFLMVFFFALATVFLHRNNSLLKKRIEIQEEIYRKTDRAHTFYKDAYDHKEKVCQDLVDYITENHNMRHDLEKCLIALSDKDLRSFGMLHIPYIEEKINLILKGTMTFHPSVEQEYCNRQIFLSGKDINELEPKI